MKTFLLSALTFTLIMAGCTNTDTNADTGNNEPQTPVLSYNIVATYPHDTSSFTQGLVFYNGQLLEGTGTKGESKLMQVDLKTGNIVKKAELDANYFGEGITVLHDTIYQLTWQEKVVLVYDAKNFKKIKDFPLNTEGWGITNDGKNLIVSDGSSNLYFYDPSTFRLLRTQGITENGSPAVNLNELEYINSFVYANQWQYNYILKIDPASGQVVAKLDLSEIANRIKSKDPHADVLNGIAYDTATQKIYITGKRWPEMYEIKFPL